MGIFSNIWDRDKDGGRKEERSFIRFAIVATTIFVLFLFVKRDNVVRWVEAGFTTRKQERQIERYEADIKALDSRINMMMSDRDTLEKYARETFLFAEPGEDVYIIGE